MKGSKFPRKVVATEKRQLYICFIKCYRETGYSLNIYDVNECYNLSFRLAFA